MNACRVIPTPFSNPSLSSVAAAVASIGLTLLFFWGLAQSSQHLQPARAVLATLTVA